MGRIDGPRLFRAAVDAMPDAVYVVDVGRFRFIDVNAAACRMLECSREEILAMGPDNVLGQPRVELERIYAAVIEAGSTPPTEVLRRRPSGAVAWVELRRTAAQSADGWMIVTVARDITARKRAEAELAAATRRMNLALEASGASVWETDLRSGEVYFSEGWARMLGERPGETRTSLSGLNALTHPDDLPRIVQASLRVMKGETAEFGEEHRVRASNGDWIWIRTAGRVVERDAGGRAVRMSGTNFDITREKREAALLALEHAVTRCLAEAEDADAGTLGTLRVLCQSYDWEAARMFRADEAAMRLRCTQSWNVPDPAYAGFAEDGRSLTFAYGDGIAGRVWQSGDPMWVPDVNRDSRVSNPALHNHFRIRSLLGFPLTSEGRTVGVLTAFSRQAREPDARLLAAVRAIGSQLGQFILRKEAEERLTQLAQFDSLTRLPNRNLFLDRAEQATRQAGRNGWQVALLVVDLDQFKRVNDTLGHAVGDELLAQAAARLQAALRTGDTVARLGGDEFAVVLPDLTSPQGAGVAAGKMLAALQAPFEIGGHELYVGASIGVATFPSDGGDVATLLRNADAAMYRAKDAGRNGYRFFTAQMNADAARRLELEKDLRRACARGEFELHYQPKALLRTGELTGVEALLRWRRPSGARVAPAEFIPVLEDTGLIAEVGDWVIREACRQIVAWRSAVPQRLSIAVNVSARQLRERRLLASVRSALAASGCPPDCLQIEITESIAMHDVEAVIALLGELRALGVRIAIDDFGTGHSSLAYLQRLPVDIVKIDRSFVRGLENSPGDRAIAAAIVAIAEAFDYRVVAEGVETEGERRLLEAMGCHEMQGFLLSPPLAPRGLLEWLRAHAPAAFAPEMQS